MIVVGAIAAGLFLAAIIGAVFFWPRRSGEIENFPLTPKL
jgi:hypothetical protein